MFDFISYVRASGLQLRILPPAEGVSINLELREPSTGYCESYQITDTEASRCANIDDYTGRILDKMAARIGRKTAQLYANRFAGNQMRERERFFRGD